MWNGDRSCVLVDQSAARGNDGRRGGAVLVGLCSEVQWCGTREFCSDRFFGGMFLADGLCQTSSSCVSRVDTKLPSFVNLEKKWL